MNTVTHQARQRGWRWPLLALSAVLACCLLAMVVSVAVLRAQRSGSATGLSMTVNGANVSQGIDPTTLVADPASYDTRPCLAHPSPDTCNGRYPVSPPHVSPAFGAHNGAGACIDGSHKILENQVLTDATGNAVGTLQLWWLPSCSSYFGYVSFSFPPSQVQSAAILVQSETSNGFIQWFDNISQLPPQVTGTQEAGPLPGSAFASTASLGQQLYSPLIYSASDPVSAHIDIELSGGITYGDFTASYQGDVKQYVG
jgi:hypothetical protein